MLEFGSIFVVTAYLPVILHRIIVQKEHNGGREQSGLGGGFFISLMNFLFAYDFISSCPYMYIGKKKWSEELKSVSKME